jgi:biopolymer transport protein TolR
MTLWERVRRKGQHHLHHRTDAELNLIPLIDILSVMVAFLLVYSTNVEIIQNSKGVEVPQSTSDAPPKVSVVVMITKDDLFVQGERVATMAEINDPNTQTIEQLRGVLDRPMLVSEAALPDAGIATREITVLADKSLPYAVVRKVMATCTAASYGKISLAVLEREKPAPASGVKPV